MPGKTKKTNSKQPFTKMAHITVRRGIKVE